MCSAGQAAMVDVGIKADTQRSATASGTVYLGHEVFELVRADRMKKGDVLRVAQLAGVPASSCACQQVMAVPS